MEITLEALGLTKDEIAARIIDAIVDRLMTNTVVDDDGAEHGKPSRFQEAMRKRIIAHTEKAIDEIAAKNVLPNVASYLEGLCLQKTNDWGEKRGESVTFTEYLVQRAEAYLNEKVSYEGKPKSEAHGYSWSPTQTRITHLVHQHLHYSIESAMKQAMVDANKSIAGGIQAAVMLKLEEVAAKLKVQVTT